MAYNQGKTTGIQERMTKHSKKNQTYFKYLFTYLLNELIHVYECNCHSMSVTLEDSLYKLAPSLNCGCSRNQLTLSGWAISALTC